MILQNLNVTTPIRSLQLKPMEKTEKKKPAPVISESKDKRLNIQA